MRWAFLNFLSSALFIRNFILFFNRLMSLKLDSFQCVHKRGKLSGFFSLNHTQKLFYDIKHHWLCMWQFYFWYIQDFNCSKLSENLRLYITGSRKLSDSHPYICHRQLRGCDKATLDVNRSGTEIIASDSVACDQILTSDHRSF